jgi:hypothetical protein
MCRRRDEQRFVCFRRRIEVHANRDHAVNRSNGGPGTSIMTSSGRHFCRRELRREEDTRTSYGNRDVAATGSVVLEEWSKFVDAGQPHAGVISRPVCQRPSLRREVPCLTPAAGPLADQFGTLAWPAHSQRESRRSEGLRQPAPEFSDRWAGSQTETI